MSNKIWRGITVACGLALVVALVAVPAMAEDVKKVRVKKIEGEHGVHKIHVDCDGEDCEHQKRVMFIGEEGDLSELHELGEDFTWVSGDDHGIHVMHGGGTFLGVQLTELTNELRAHFGVPADQGVMVAKVVDGSPAAKAGVQVGDVITAVDGEAVESGSQLAGRIRKHEDGASVALELWRDGRVESLSPILEKQEMEMGAMKKRAMKMRALGGGGHHGMRKIEVRCAEGDDEKDCEISMGEGDFGDFDCGGGEECAVRVECNDDGCECTANGDAVDCETLPGFRAHHGD